MQHITVFGRFSWMKTFFLSIFLLVGNLIYAQKLSSQQEKNFQQEILQYINQYRSQKGLSALVLDENLNSIAYQHSRDMSTRAVAFGHDGFRDRLSQAKKQNPKMLGFAENVAYGMQTSQEVTKDWYGSAGHKRNLLGNYTLTGIGVERASDGYLYFTQIFER